MRARAQPAMELCEQVAHSRAHFAGFPHGWEWWTLVCVCAVVMSLTAEYLCMQAPPPPSMHTARTARAARAHTAWTQTHAHVFECIGRVRGLAFPRGGRVAYTLSARVVCVPAQREMSDIPLQFVRTRSSGSGAANSDKADIP